MRRLGVVLLCALAALAGCTDSDRADLETRDPSDNSAVERPVTTLAPEAPEAPDDPGSPADIARAASFVASGERTARTSPGGVSLEVAAQFYEGVRYQGWEAPAHCSFSSTVSVEINGVEVVLESPPLNGPKRDDDRSQAGQLGVVLPWDGDGDGITESLAVVVVVFDHDSSATLRLANGGANGPADTQPVDGWTPLAIVLPADEFESSGSVSVDLSHVRQDGSASSVTLTIPIAAPDGFELVNLTEAWAFDESVVDASCTPPPDVGEVGDPVNERLPDEVGTNGAVIRPKPDLPPPGEQPADPEAATAEALHAIRTVYDITNLYDADKLVFLDNAEQAAIVQAEAERLRVVEPYVDQLDPIFDSMVFTSPTEGKVLYRVGPGYSWETGRVLVVDGTWRVAMGTLCRDLSDAGYQCKGVQNDPGPSPLG